VSEIILIMYFKNKKRFFKTINKNNFNRLNFKKEDANVILTTFWSDKHLEILILIGGKCQQGLALQK
jgi:hypothetical protein